MGIEPNTLSTGAFLLVAPEDQAIADLISAITMALQPPLSAPAASEVIGLIASAVHLVVCKLHQPTQPALQLKDDCNALHNLLTKISGQGICAAHLALHGKATKHPIWVYLAKLAAENSDSTNVLRLLYIGCSVILSLHHKKPIPAVLVQHAREMAGTPMSAEAMESVLNGFVPDEHLSASWPARLARQWREVVKLYSQGDIPPPSWRDRVTGQLLGAALNPAASHAGGALDHRQLSPQQFVRACLHIKTKADEDCLEGIFGILLLRTGLSIDLLAELPLNTLDATHLKACLDPMRGVVEIDLQAIVFEPAKALAGCHSGGYRLRIHLPAVVAQQLKERSIRYPGSSCLRDLYPGDGIPESRHQIYLGSEEIEATWARLRSSAGPHLLRAGVNGLLAALLTLDLSLICRSKLHYALVPARELHDAEAALYKALGWVAPVPQSTETGFGSRVVPMDDSITQHDKDLLSKLHAARPGQRSSVESLVEHHNHYARLTGWRLSLLLALRASSRIALTAAIDPNDRWLPVHDKHTRSDKGHQPVPLCPFAVQTIGLYKEHCKALGERIQKLEGPQHALARWSSAVAASRNIRLLFIVDAKSRIRPLPSISFTRSQTPEYQLPEDVGRKVIENHLRWRGLPATLIDQMLRHTHAGQVPLSSFHHQCLASSMNRLSGAIEGIAHDYFSTPATGLRSK
jgi:hypothetical protein